MNGGYTLIDSSKFDFTSSVGYKVEGIYQKYYNAINGGKLIIYDKQTSKSPTTEAVSIDPSTGVITANVGLNTFSITENDTINNL